MSLIADKWFCLLARVPYQHIAVLTAGDITIADGVATIRPAAGNWTLHPADDTVLCGPRAVVRWLMILNLAVTHPSTRTIADALKKAPAIDHRSPHVCPTAPVLDERTHAVPLLPPIDQWGYEPFPLQPLTPHSLSRRTRDLLAGDLGAHRDLPIDPDPDPETTPPESHAVTAPPARAYQAAGATAAWDRRRQDLQDWPGSSTCAPTSNDAPTSSTGGPRNCWTVGCRPVLLGASIKPSSS